MFKDKLKAFLQPTIRPAVWYFVWFMLGVYWAFVVAGHLFEKDYQSAYYAFIIATMWILLLAVQHTSTDIINLYKELTTSCLKTLESLTNDLKQQVRRAEKAEEELKAYKTTGTPAKESK